MRRSWPCPRNRDAEGHQRSMELATALAQVCDPEALERLLHAKMMLDAVGGQVFIAAKRDLFDPRTLEPTDDPEAGLYETTGYIFVFEHIATALREQDRAHEHDAKRPVAVGIPESENSDGGDDGSPE